MPGPLPRRADRTPGRCRAGARTAWRRTRTGSLGPRWLVLLFRRQQLLRLGAEAAEFFISWPVFLHPLDGLLVLLASLLLLPEFPVGHGQEEGVPGKVLTTSQFLRLL